MQEPSSNGVTPPRPGLATTITVAIGAVVQFGGIVAVLTLGFLNDDAVGDRSGAVPLAAVYGLPAVLAALSLRRRPALLMAAGIASLVLAVFPFSLHSFVFGPVALVYLVAYAKWPKLHDTGERAATVAVVVPLLLGAAFVALLWHEDPICYAKSASGEVTIDRDPGSITTGSQTIEPGSDIVERGCSSDTVVWWEALTSLALSCAALAAGIYLTAPNRPRKVSDRSSCRLTRAGPPLASRGYPPVSGGAERPKATSTLERWVTADLCRRTSPAPAALFATRLHAVGLQWRVTGG